ncbi:MULTISPECIES: ATP-dependent zinc protease family protein [Thalassotalea]|uniref:ATP-dependent zinc protease family protein n=1 Tax=Thalassotalea TaxID=1518149 RepID=UPI0009420AB9|nr:MULTISPECIES: RimK/LysX family protein [Thalassotalea]MDO6425776.1 RimK/LysX family protein [Thalassotalea sp. 1_MG-2023]OKY27288.1 ribosomal protein S6 modification protein [Thalassotalea sp. PP2-459]
MNERIIIGRLETVNLPDLEINQLTVRVDTGAQTSSLHVDNIQRIKIGNKPGVAFDIHPEIHNVQKVVRRKALVHDVRKIKSSNGISEQRYVIKTGAKLGDFEWDIEITLTDRSDMTYLMLLGREALGSHFYVDAANVFVASDIGEEC